MNLIIADHSWWQYPVWAMDPAGALQQPGARTERTEPGASVDTRLHEVNIKIGAPCEILI